MKKILTIIAALGLDELTEIPEWITFFPEGENEVEGEGKYIVDEDAWQMTKAVIDRRGIEIVIDYEHQTVKDMQAPAAGWNRDWRYEPGVGIQARVDWTEQAKNYLLAGEYRYFSPVFHIRKSDRRLCGVHSVALTNAPRTNNLQPLLAKLEAAQTDEDEHMLKMILAALGLEETATEEEVKTAIAKLKAENKVLVVDDQIVACLGIDEGSDVSTVVASINALKQETKGMVSQEDFNKLQTKLAKRDADEIVAKAMEDGKITPDQKEWAEEYAGRDLEGFKTFVAKAPVVVPVAPLGDKKKEDGDLNINPDTMEIAAKLGVSKEDLEKYGK